MRFFWQSGKQKKWRVMVRGRNYLLKDDFLRKITAGEAVTERLTKYSFFTTRFVAADVETAAEVACNLIRRELNGAMENAPDDTPRLFIEDAGELNDFKGVNAPGSGFVWYAEDDDDEDAAAS